MILSGITVIEFSNIVAGPFVGELLATLGAEVIKIEHPIRGDPMRNKLVFSDFIALNRGKKSLALDISHPEGYDVLSRLVRRSDVFVENMSAEAVRKLKIDYDTISKINPDIIYVSIKGYHPESKFADKPLYGVGAEFLSGLAQITGFESGPPVRSGIALADILCALYATLGIVSVKYAIQKGLNVSRYLRLSLIAANLHAMTGYFINYSLTNKLPKRTGSGKFPSLTSCPSYDCFRTKDDKWIWIGVFGDEHWKLLVKIPEFKCLDKHEYSRLEDRITHSDKIRHVLENIISNMDSSELLKKLEASGIPYTPVNTIADAINYEPLAPNFSIIKYDNKYCYIPNFPIFGLPVKELTEVPELGSNTREILLRLGFSESEIESLIKKGIVKC